MRHALATAWIAVLAMVSFEACGSDEPPIENLCGWLGDPEGCLRMFFADVGPRCGALGRDAGPKGAFAARDKLDACVLAAPNGGQVLFDPPLDLKSFPLRNASFKIISGDGTDCGAGSFGGPYTFAVTVAPYPPDSGVPGAGGSGGATGGRSAPIRGGTFSSQSPKGREVFDTSCPGGEVHHFDRLQTGKCPAYNALLPRAELESSAGALGIGGFVRFRVYYPPPEGPLENAAEVAVEYFDCSFPGAPAPCADHAQNGSETDVDCGGGCAPCQSGQGCSVDSDCASSSCAVDVTGAKKCAPTGTGGAAGSGGSGGA